MEERKAGRPELYTPEIADKICAEIATSTKSLKTICKADDMPSVMTVLRWLRKDEGGFCALYARAKEEQADFMAEEMIEIADDSSEDLMTIEKNGKTIQVENKEVTNRSRLRVDTRKWIASKLKPKKYADKIDVGYRDKDGNPANAPAPVVITTIFPTTDKDI